MSNTGESARGSHRIECLAHCTRKFGYRYLMKLMPATEKKGTALGTCTHAGLDAYYHHANIDDAVAAIMALPPRVAFAAIDGINLVEKYTKRYHVRVDGNGGVQDDAGRVIFVEKEFEYPVMGTDEVLTRRLDLGIVTPDGRLLILDHKTAGRPRERLRRTLRDITLFTQAYVGRMIAEREGLKWGGVVLNLIPTSSSGDFVRELLKYPLAFLRDAESDILYWCGREREIMDELRAGNIDPWRLARTFQCWQNGYSCDYGPLCTEGKIALNRYVVEE